MNAGDLPLLLALALQGPGAPVNTGDTGDTGAGAVDPQVGEARAREARDGALEWLVETQNADGSWGLRTLAGVVEGFWKSETLYAWQVAAVAIGSMALDTGPAAGDMRLARRRSLGWLTETPLPLRPDDWDTDHHWAALYGFVAMVRASADGGLMEGELGRAITRRGQEFYAMLERGQSVNGGWAYYDGGATEDVPITVVPTWDTSFCTALVLPALLAAPEEWGVAGRRVARAISYLRRCALPGGAYSYDLTAVPALQGFLDINCTQGSLARTQVANWALVLAGDRTVTPDVLRGGLDDFFKHHVYLDIAHQRPIPHEAWFDNSGYFYYFGHYYAALVIELLPEQERAAYHARLRPHLLRYQNERGWACDFNHTDSLRLSSTAFLALALTAGLEH